MPQRHLHPAIAHLVEQPLPKEEFLRRIETPLSEEEKQEMLDLMEWFTRRYPTPLERLAYVRRKYREIVECSQTSRRIRGDE